MIQNARPEDAAALGRLGSLLVAIHHDFDPDRFIAPGPDTERGYGGFLVSRVERQDVILLVAEVDRAVLGYASSSFAGAIDPKRTSRSAVILATRGRLAVPCAERSLRTEMIVRDQDNR